MKIFTKLKKYFKYIKSKFFKKEKKQNKQDQSLDISPPSMLKTPRKIAAKSGLK